MSRTLLVPLAAYLAAVGIGATPPAARVNACTRPEELRELLASLSSRKDPESQLALLWGSVLYRGVGAKSDHLPLQVFAAGEQAASPRAADVRTRVFQVWWEQVIGSRERIPDFRRIKKKRWETMIVNGKPTPILTYDMVEESKTAAAALKVESERLLRDSSPVDTLQIYRAWNDPTGNLVPDATLATIAADLNSPFRNFAIAELALREKKRGKPGPYAARWTRIRTANAKALSIRCLVQREREQLAKK